MSAKLLHTGPMMVYGLKNAGFDLLHNQIQEIQMPRFKISQNCMSRSKIRLRVCLIVCIKLLNIGINIEVWIFPEQTIVGKVVLFQTVVLVDFQLLLSCVPEILLPIFNIFLIIFIFSAVHLKYKHTFSISIRAQRSS